MTCPVASEWEHEVGSVSVLNVTGGDVTIQVAGDDDHEKARTMIEEMLRMGYVLTIKDKAGRHRRVTKFDPKKMTYYVKDSPTETSEVPANKGQVTAVPRSAGG